MRTQLHDYLGWEGPVTSRQHETWLEWFNLQRDHPSPVESATHAHIQQVAVEARRGYVKDPSSVKYEDLDLKWKTLIPPEPVEEPDEDELQELAEKPFVWAGKEIPPERFNRFHLAAAPPTKEQAAKLKPADDGKTEAQRFGSLYRPRHPHQQPGAQYKSE